VVYPSTTTPKQGKRILDDLQVSLLTEKPINKYVMKSTPGSPNKTLHKISETNIIPDIQPDGDERQSMTARSIDLSESNF
jgi:hypothetical protein